MVAEEAACSGVVEVREAELAVEEEAPAAASEERVGEAVSDPVVVAGGDSGDLSGEASNLVAKPDPAVLGEDGEVVESNAAPGCAETVDEEDGVDGGCEAGAVEDAPMANGHVHPEAPMANGHVHSEAPAPETAEIAGSVEEGMNVRIADEHDHPDTSITESKGCVVEEVNGEEAATEIAESAGLVEEEVGDQELEGMDVRIAGEHDHTNTSTTESEVHEDSLIKQADADATGLMEQEAISSEQDGSDVPIENGHTHVSADCGEGAERSDVQVNQSNGEEADANSVKPVEQEVTAVVQDGLDGSVSNGHGHVDASGHGYVTAADLNVQGSKSKGEDTETFEKLVTATVDHDRADIAVANGHNQVERSIDSGEVETKSEVCDSKEKSEECATDSTELVKQETTTEEQGVEDVSVVNGCDHPNTNADSDEAPTQILVSSKESAMVQSVVEAVESVHHEGTLKIDQQTEGDAKVANKKVPKEDILTNGYEHVEETAETTSVLKPLVGNGQHDFTAVDRLDNRADDNREDTLQGTFTTGVDKPAMEADALAVENAIDSTETKEKHEKTNGDIVQGHDLSKDKVECGVREDEVSTLQPVESVLCSTVEVEKEEISDQQQTAVSLQDTERELSATNGNHLADNTELKQESDMEDSDGANLCATPGVVPALHLETRSSDLADDDGAEVENSTPACDLGASSGAHTGDNDSKENSTAAVAQVEQDVPSQDDGNHPADGTPGEICSENANAFTTSSCVAETEYVQDIASTTVDVIHDKHNDDDENMHDNTDITGNRSEPKLEINMDNEDRGDIQVIKPYPVYLMKVPRFMSESHWEKIQDAQIRLDELTQKRDAINVLRQKKKALCDEYREKLEAARQEERGARTAHGDKRNDLNSVQSMIGRMNRANSIQEIDDMIAMKEKIIAHESISLKEEKRLLQDIKELKAQKKQLSSNMGSKAEMGEAFEQKEHIHEQQKILKKDSDVLLTNLKSLEDKTRFIKKAFDDERDALRKLTEEHQAAHEVRQKAYDEWFELKKEPGKKNKFFFMYRKDSRVAKEYVDNGDMTGLVLFCNNQVESFMELWNKDDDFRRQYVESNKNSTLRRLGTSDGRKLGPDEVPPEIPRYSNRMQSNPPLLPVPTTHASASASEATPAKPASPVTVVEEKTFPVLQSSQSSKPSKPKVVGSSSSKDTPGAPIPEREDVEKSEKEKKRRMEQELELSRQSAELAIREEELRQEKAAAEKERLRLEQKAKAKEAEERKRRKAEKAQERAEFRARKEAELMEKKKAKRDRTRGSTSADSGSGSGEANAEATVTNDADSSTTENSRGGDLSQHRALKKRPPTLKQLNKMEPMPLPLRNKGRRKMRQYIMVAVAAVISVLALVVASKYVPSNFRASSS
uniref:Proton pump-interactor 1 n=1 Tax=Oryza punctata TaxID=4537 RepID=A0A0E0LWU5_ORYPU